MDSVIKPSKIWIRFETKKQDGSVIKLRIQDLPKNRMDDFMVFLTTFYKDESMHKAAGVYTNREAIEEYKELLTLIYESNPREIAICCLDTDSEDFGEIFAVSIVQRTFPQSSLKHSLKMMGIELRSKELKAMFQVLNVFAIRFPESLNEKYETFYHGRGIVVHPDYRGLRICSEIVKQRRLMCKEHKIPMTCAWMTSMGSQKAAERDGWETVAEITIRELSDLTGLDFGKDVPSYKLMIATEN